MKYEIIKSPKHSTKNKTRFIVIDPETGKTIVDKHGKGYNSKKSAHKGYMWKTNPELMRKKQEEKARKRKKKARKQKEKEKLKHRCFMAYMKNTKTGQRERKFFKTEKRAINYVDNMSNLELSSIKAIDAYEASLIIQDDMLFGTKCAYQVGEEEFRRLQKKYNLSEDELYDKLISDFMKTKEYRELEQQLNMVEKWV